MNMSTSCVSIVPEADNNFVSENSTHECSVLSLINELEAHYTIKNDILEILKNMNIPHEIISKEYAKWYKTNVSKANNQAFGSFFPTKRIDFVVFNVFQFIEYLSTKL